MLKFYIAADKLQDLESNEIYCDDWCVYKNIFQFHELPTQNMCFVNFFNSASRGASNVMLTFFHFPPIFLYKGNIADVIFNGARRFPFQFRW